MTDDRVMNIAASVRDRLRNVARAGKLEFQLALSEFAIERLLYRLGTSRYAEDFVLKGAMLFRLWSAERHRATWDLDLLGRELLAIAKAETIVRDICSMSGKDGIAFDADSVRGEVIRAADEDAGIRLRFTARLADARIPMQIDIGFGDVVTPGAERRRYPTLLDHPAPDILAYPREAVVAEKLDAMISLGITNSRMKDFYDVKVLASAFQFDGARLSSAIAATFARRGTPFPGARPMVLTADFLGDPVRATQWRAFLRRGRLEGPSSAAVLAEELERFLGPVLGALTEDRGFDAWWEPGGPWRSRGESGGRVA